MSANFPDIQNHWTMKNTAISTAAANLSLSLNSGGRARLKMVLLGWNDLLTVLLNMVLSTLQGKWLFA